MLLIDTINLAALKLAQKIRNLNPAAYALWGIPRGGVPAAMMTAQVGNVILMANRFKLVDTPQEADILIDDLIDSGRTRERYHRETGKPVGALFSKRATDDEAEGWKLYGLSIPAAEWVVFPWEGSAEGSADDIVTRLLQYLGEDPSRSGLKETPARVLKAWGEWCSGYKLKPEEVLKTFEDGAEGVDEMVLMQDIPIYSHCEHHLAPFFGVAHIGYIPNGKIVGLSKLIRLAEVFARRLQVQERLTNQIANALVEHLGARGVGVILECRHLCMESRGVCKAGAITTTSAMRGVMLDKPAARAELMSLIRRK